MFYKAVTLSLLLLLIACSESEQAINTKTKNQAALSTSSSIEETQRGAETEEKDRYTDKVRPPTNPPPERSDNTLDKSHFEILGFSLGYSPFNNLQDKLGKATVFESESDHDGFTVCYTSSRKNDNTLMVFWSWYDTLDSVKIYADKSQYPENKHCTESSLVISDVATSSGLKLSLSRAELETLMRVPPYEVIKNKTFKFWGEYEENIDNHPHYKKLSYNQDVVASFQDDRLTLLHLEVVAEPIGDVWIE